MTPAGRTLLAKIGLMGRTKRTSILLFLILSGAVQVALGTMAGRGLLRRGPPREPEMLAAAAVPWVGLALTLVFLWLAWRRFQDQDRPGWLALVPTAFLYATWLLPMPFPFQTELASLLGLGIMIAFLIGLFLPPTVGPNRYGRDPRGWRSPEHYAEERRQGRAT